MHVSSRRPSVEQRGNPSDAHWVALGIRAEAETDDGFLFVLFSASRAVQLAMSGLPQITIDALVEMQFRGQTASYRARFPSAQRLILERGGRPVGRMVVEREEHDLYVVDIAVLPEARGFGLGGAAVAAVQREAAAAGLGVRAVVMPDNGPSLAVFGRRGFAPTGRMAGPSLELRWTA